MFKDYILVYDCETLNLILNKTINQITNSNFFQHQTPIYLVQNCQAANCLNQLNTVQQILNFIPGCSEYVDVSQQVCKQCQINYLLSDGLCKPTCSQESFLKQIIGIFDGKCIKCDLSCSSCNSVEPTSCLKCQDGLYSHPDKLCKVCDVNSGFKIDGQKCICQEGYQFDNQKCVQQYLSYKSNTFSQGVIDEVTQQAKSSSQAAFASTTFLSSIQNMLSSSSIGISINGITCFKLSYLLIVNVALPLQIYSPLNVIKDQCPSKSFGILNVFSLINKNSSEYQNQKYQQLDISYNILQTSGQALILFLICLTVFIIFYYLLLKLKNQKSLQISTWIYDKLFSGFVIQYFQLVMVMFAIGINQQFKQFYLNFDSNQIGIQITLILIFIPITILILLYQYKFLNFPKSKEQTYNFYEITRKKIQNDAIFECQYRRNFMIIYLFYECFLVPLCFLQFSFNWKISGILAITLQLALLIIVIRFMPFYSRLTNFYFLIDSLLWLGLYIQFFILSYYGTRSNINDYASTLDDVSYSFLINLQIIMLYLTFHLLMVLIVELFLFVKNKLKEKQKKKEAIAKQNLSSENNLTQNALNSTFSKSSFFKNYEFDLPNHKKRYSKQTTQKDIFKKQVNE